MSHYKRELLELSGVLIPDKTIFDDGYDKNKLMKVCRENGFPHPLTIDLFGIKDFDNNNELVDFSYPALLKPNLTSGGRGHDINQFF